ncbi:MAG: hypothetical protein RLZZ172_3043, partial [Bacteroidota bacterium]
MSATPFELIHPNVIITGGASGIGLSIVQLFQLHGAWIDVLDLKKPDQQWMEENNIDQQRVHFHAVDITSQQDVKDAVSLIAIQRGIGILINNAGIAHVGNVVNTAEDDFMKVFNVNVRGAYNCMQACIPYMEEQSEGLIINMASIAATVGIADRFAYSMSKGAILSMTLSVARDYVKKGIRCNCISPARVHTPFVDGFVNKHYPGQQAEMFQKLASSQPIGRMGQPDEVAALAFFLASRQASFITGCDYPLDGGVTR